MKGEVAVSRIYLGPDSACLRRSITNSIFRTSLDSLLSAAIFWSHNSCLSIRALHTDICRPQTRLQRSLDVFGSMASAFTLLFLYPRTQQRLVSLAQWHEASAQIFYRSTFSLHSEQQLMCSSCVLSRRRCAPEGHRPIRAAVPRILRAFSLAGS